jgi:cell division initiation protein
MIDLTPLEVRKKKGDFRRVMRGYESGLVDDFLDLAADRMEELVRDNLQLNERVRRLEEQVSDFRDRERALTEALVTAQEMREEMREQTLREADIARREAESEAAKIRQGAELARERAEESIRHLRERQRELVGSYRNLLERELAELAITARAIEGSEHADAQRGRGTAAGEAAPQASRQPAPQAPQAPPPAPLPASPEPARRASPPTSPRPEAAAGQAAAGPAVGAAANARGTGAAAPLFTNEDLETVFDFEDELLDPRLEPADEAQRGERAPPSPPELQPFRFTFEDESN